MADINHVVLVGRLTRDAELRYTNSGVPICKFSIAINRRKKSGDDWVEEANFFDAVLIGRLGEAINQYLTKGKQIGLQGELRQNRWEQDGQPRSKVEIFATNVQLLGSRGGGSRDSSQYGAPSNESKGRPQNDNDINEFEDDIPF